MIEILLKILFIKNNCYHEDISRDIIFKQCHLI